MKFKQWLETGGMVSQPQTPQMTPQQAMTIFGIKGQMPNAQQLKELVAPQQQVPVQRRVKKNPFDFS